VSAFIWIAPSAESDRDPIRKLARLDVGGELDPGVFWAWGSFAGYEQIDYSRPIIADEKRSVRYDILARAVSLCGNGVP